MLSQVIGSRSDFFPFFPKTVFSAETSTPVVPAGTWTHISCTYTATGGKSEIYVNGVLKKQELTGSGILSQVKSFFECTSKNRGKVLETDINLFEIQHARATRKRTM